MNLFVTLLLQLVVVLHGRGYRRSLLRFFFSIICPKIYGWGFSIKGETISFSDALVSARHVCYVHPFVETSNLSELCNLYRAIGVLHSESG